MTTCSSVLENQTCFQFKTSFAPCTILQITRYDLAALDEQIAKTVQRASTFFAGSPIVIDIEKINESGTLDFAKIKEMILANGMVPVGVRGGNDEQNKDAAVVGLPVLTIGRFAQADNSKKQEEPPAVLPAKLVTHPIRSGMHVYAKDTDLIVTAPVSAGAELLSDGHIHIYGPLRGRALAGVRGNRQARIFCRTLEAELISIAGYYLTKEDIQALPESNGMLQIYLDQEQIRIEGI